MNDFQYPCSGLFIGGEWISTNSRATGGVYNPATGQQIGHVMHATPADVTDALAAAERGFSVWRRTPPAERAATLHAAATLLRERQEASARVLTLEQGKPLAEARGEIGACAAALEWAAVECKQSHQRILPPRAGSKRFTVYKEPVGAAAAFSPWNFPAFLAARKVAAALGAGCSLVIKPAEETPASFLCVAKALDDAGLPKGVLNVVFGNPAEISRQLIASPVIRKIAFTGSTRVGKELASLAGSYAKPVVMELGGHAPVVIAEDAEIDSAVKLSIASKFRNAGQVCVSPTRFFVHDSVHDRFLREFCAGVEALRVGDGLDGDTQMGPLANARRLDAVERIVEDALTHGATCNTGGRRRDGVGHFFAPTVLSNVPATAQIMTQEPFGPIAVINRFATLDEAMNSANATPFALAAYAFTSSAHTIAKLSEGLDAGMIGINGFTIAYPDSPTGGRRDSGYGSEGGPEGFEAYLMSKCVNEQ
jgi:succinate-semialdehyde dehydrogenase/glutarate-semialdehyde dehydrogenase